MSPRIVHCAQRTNTSFLPPLLRPLLLLSKRGSADCRSLRVSNDIHAPSKLARYLSRDGGLIDLPLRAFNEGSPRPRVARAQKIISLHPLLCSASKKDIWPLPFYCSYFTQSQGRGQAESPDCARSDRARSASKEGTWPLPPHPSEAARCASKGDQPGPPLITLTSRSSRHLRLLPDLRCGTPPHRASLSDRLSTTP